MDRNFENDCTVAIAKDVAGQQRTKHIDVRQKWLSEQHEQGKIEVKFVPGEKQKADILTKPLHKTKFQENRRHFLTNLILALCMFNVVISFSLKPVPPVVYVDSDLPYFGGLQDVDFHYEEINLCDKFFNNITNRPEWKKLLYDCNEMYREATFKQMKDCIPSNTVSRKYTTSSTDYENMLVRAENKIGRVTRAIPALIFLVISVVSNGGALYAVGRGSVNAENINIVKQRLFDLQDLHKQAERSLNATIDGIKQLDKIDKKVIEKLNYIDQSISNYPLIVARYTYVSNYLSEVKTHLKMVNKGLKDFRVAPELMDLAKRPYWSDAAAKFSTVETCNVNKSDPNFNLKLTFYMPQIDKDVKILRARSFKFWNKTAENRYCLTKYTGPRLVLTNTSLNCYDDLDSDYEHDAFIMGYTCDKQDQSLSWIENTFTETFCDKEPNYHHKEQVIMAGGQNLIYCPNQQIMIRDKQYPCPEHVFALPVAESFVLDSYKFAATRRTESIVNTLEKQISDDIITSLSIDTVRINGVNTTTLDREFNRLNDMVNSILGTKLNLRQMPSISESFGSPFKIIHAFFSDVWRWMEKGLLFVVIAGLFMLLTVSMPLLDLMVIVVKFVFKIVKMNLTRLQALFRRKALTRRSRRYDPELDG